MRTLLVCLCAALFACPPAERKAPAPASAPCSKVGQSCEHSPGKLGTCVTKDGCDEAKEPCFVCQSQH